MESSTTDQQSFGADVNLGEPHFDEEATLLSARPVVPIKTVAAKPRFKRSWALGLALTGAVLMGVIATAFYFTRFKSDSLTAADSQTISAGAEAMTPVSDSGQGAPETRDGASSNLATSDGNTRSVEPAAARVKTSADSANKPLPRRATNGDEALRTREQDEADYRAERRAERREAKERKRQEREDRGDKRADEVLRIREIFEGLRKP